MGAVSLYLGARCSLEFGPNFRFPISLPQEAANGNRILPLCSVVPTEHPPSNPEPIVPQPAMIPAVVSGLNSVSCPTEPMTGPAPVKVSVQVMPDPGPTNTLPQHNPTPPMLLDSLQYLNK